MNKHISRRDFVKTGTSATAALLAGAPLVHAGHTSQITVGLVGCGGRGTGAAENCIESSPDVKLVAMGDLFKDRLDASRKVLSKNEKGYAVDDDKTFVGFDAYKKVLATDIDLVILATPPGFRPLHFKAAIEAGKHVFFEKPVAVDPAGVRTVLEYGRIAKEKGLAVLPGTQRRHQKSYMDTIARIHDGAIGDIVAARAYWNSGGVWVKPRKPGQTEMEYQLRNWYYFPWLCGDHIVEQHVHNIDVINWAMRSHPVSAVAVGGRQVRTEEQFGVIYDHFAVDFEYPGGVHMMSMCRHWGESLPKNVSEAVVGTKGTSDCADTINIYGGETWKATPGKVSPIVQEHADLIASIRSGKPVNGAEGIAHSTLAAIMGREAAYTGQMIKWDEFLKSPLKLMPDELDFNMAPPEAKIPVPGKKA